MTLKRFGVLQVDVRSGGLPLRVPVSYAQNKNWTTCIVIDTKAVY